MTADRKWRALIVAAWCVAFAAALLLDRAVAETVAPIAKDVKYSPSWQYAKLPGWLPCTVLAAAVVTLFHPWRWRGGLMVMGAAFWAGVMYSIARWVVGRVRPVKEIAPFELNPFFNGFEGLFNSHNLSFPSGHTALAFAAAAALAHLLPRWNWLFCGIAAMTGVQRVLEQAHYASDVVAAAAFGVLAFRTSLAITLHVLGDPATARYEAAPSAAPVV